MPQSTGEDHQLLLLTPAGIPGGEQLAGHFSRQVLGDQPAPRIVRRACRSGESEPRPGAEDKPVGLGPGPSTGAHQGLPPCPDGLIDQPPCTALGRRRIPGRVVTRLCTVRWEIPRRTATFFVEPFSVLTRKRTAVSPVGTGRVSNARSSPLTISPMPAPERSATAAGARRPSAPPDLSRHAAPSSQFRQSQDATANPRLKTAEELAATEARRRRTSGATVPPTAVYGIRKPCRCAASGGHDQADVASVARGEGRPRQQPSRWRRSAFRERSARHRRRRRRSGAGVLRRRPGT